MKIRAGQVPLLFVATWAMALAAHAGDVVITDATNLLSTDTGAVYRLLTTGEMEVIAEGAPLASPAGILEYGDGYLVTDIGTFFGLNDGQILLVADGAETIVVYEGEPLSSPFGMVRVGDELIVSDFGEPAAILDGTVYGFDLDPDDDGADGPYPLTADAIRVIWSGDPLQGPNQMVDLGDDLALVADDSGWLYEIDLRDPAAAKGPSSMATVMPPIAFGPAFADPVGLARSANGYIVVDAATQEVYELDTTGTSLTLLLGASPASQLLGAGTDETGEVVLVADSGSLFSSAEDGEVVALDATSIGPLVSGPPLMNPFSAAFARTSSSR